MARSRSVRVKVHGLVLILLGTGSGPTIAWTFLTLRPGEDVQEELQNNVEKVEKDVSCLLDLSETQDGSRVH